MVGAGSLFQIQEPDAGAARDDRRRPGRAIWIDLGTTHSLVALAPHGAPPRVLDVQGRSLVPSVVSYVGDTPVVGGRAVAQAAEHPESVLVSAKRFVGRGHEDINFAHPYRLVDESGVIRFEVGERRVTPIEASAATGRPSAAASR